jgi:hypothetical protein
LLIADPIPAEAPFAIVVLRSKFHTGDGWSEEMRILTVGAVALALAATPAYAQMAGKRPRDDGKKVEQKKPEIDEKAYNDALKRIPEPKEKYDPWSGARPATADKKASK